MSGKSIGDEQFEKWVQTYDELLCALAETATGDNNMRYTLGRLMLS